MTALELRSSLGLAAVSGLRLAGLFVILPVFALYAETLAGGDSRLMVGIALGAYGLTQAILQIPFGAISDRWGRKPAIYLGLVVFAIGSFVAAAADSLGLVILGRVIQGAGAISGAVIALAADLTRDEVRTKAMAIIGITIGASFTLSLGAGPLLAQGIGVPGIFALTGLLAIAAMALVRFAIPDPPAVVRGGPRRASVAEVLRDAQLARLDLGVFVLHAVLMALFVVVPFSLRAGGLDGGAQWKVYLPVVLLSFALMGPAIGATERRGWHRSMFLAAIALLVVALGTLGVAQTSIPGLAAGLLLFFTGFNFLEASLPSLISRVAPASAKGTAAGVYSSLQFLGTFAGAAAGGWLSQHWGAAAVFAFCGMLMTVWFLAALGMSVPVVRTYPLEGLDAGSADRLAHRLRTVPGVRDAVIAPSHRWARLQVDRARFDEQNVIRILQRET